MKTFVFDLDDTLLSREKRVGTDTRRALLDSAQAGAKLIFATSRPERAVRRFIDAELLGHAALITLNGAILRESPTHLQRFAIMGKKALGLIEHEALGTFARFSIEFDGYEFASNVNYTDRELDEIQSATREMFIPLERIEADKISKVSVNGLGKKVEQYCDFISDLGMKPISCMDGTFLNVVDPAVDKSSTLEVVFERLGIEKQDVVVFGDDLPDLAMMKLAGLAVAMGNATEEVKAAADTVIGDCDADEIGRFIRQYS
jgi:hypothetical protein